ncbi:sugar transferase [Aquimarina intermedia]|uniref:Lipopolysaccharide/colanic/teichoic acid biosynthesis glycosyltransferase n=1 Tax=Aquimarina intermedia TaxID=350814 RepID=A0A5S5C9J0_9FLAO|nr:sugar transferase [Aquimarina intermedia]TYP75162.1 lipopolysaccharide/colanic/teichoic acid biosynthesis glycosyltransferase [Aquimarina intermedia]
MYKNFFKRLFDFVAAFLGLLLISPILLISIIILFFTNNGKPFFYQTRPGKNEKLFKIIKLKSMNDKKDENGELLPYKERITAIGAFVRRYSLDEIPQLFNVLKGDMSLIGPRPLLVKYLPLYNSKQKRRHEVKPGITGWAQVNGRNAISWTQKFDYDVWYVDNISFKTDLIILIKTIKKVVLKEGVNSQANLNMPVFTGNEENISKI